MDGADSWGDVQVNTCGFAQLLSAPALFHENEGGELEESHYSLRCILCNSIPASLKPPRP